MIEYICVSVNVCVYYVWVCMYMRGRGEYSNCLSPIPLSLPKVPESVTLSIPGVFSLPHRDTFVQPWHFLGENLLVSKVLPVLGSSFGSLAFEEKNWG